jgi:hypothetical protein
MRVFFVLAWVAVGVLFYAWHAGPGQQLMALDEAGRLAAAAADSARTGNWSEAVARYDSALAALPEDRPTHARQLRLERAKAQLQIGRLPEARVELGALVDGLEADANAPQDLLDDALQALAVSQYYTTWLMRLEGEPETIWEPEIESARQIHRLLAEEAEQRGDSKKQEHFENEEATIRLARMGLDELQALKLPCQCCNCKAGACKSACKKPGQSPNEPKDARGASMGPPPDNAGN